MNKLLNFALIACFLTGISLAQTPERRIAIAKHSRALLTRYRNPG